MELIYSLLRIVVLTVTGLLLALGSFFTGHTGVVVSVPAATTTPAAPSFPTATTTVKVAVPAKVKMVTPAKSPAQKSSDLLSGPKNGPAGQTFVQSSLPSLPTEQLNTLARASLVNILCTTQSGGSFNPISGSGVIIDSRGIILTNAHVAQYFLLHDYPTAGNIQCVVRAGSPAQPHYTAELLYLPPAWIAANAPKISSSTPTGTGENDYAFLYITGTTNPADPALPAAFPALPMDGGDPASGDQMLLAAYPAGFLGGISISLDLYITSAVATVGQVYTFADQANIDLFSLGGTIVSQSGSSGGAVVSTQGKLMGLIATEIPAATTAGRDLRAITIAHINRSLQGGGQGGVAALLSQNAANYAAVFNATVAPAETKVLETALTQ